MKLRSLLKLGKLKMIDNPMSEDFKKNLPNELQPYSSGIFKDFDASGLHSF